MDKKENSLYQFTFHMLPFGIAFLNYQPLPPNIIYKIISMYYGNCSSAYLWGQIDEAYVEVK